MARAVPMWALLLVLLMAAVAVVAFGAMVRSRMKAGRIDGIVMDVASTPRTLSHLLLDPRTAEPFEALAVGDPAPAPANFVRNAAQPFVDPGYELLTAYSDAAKRPVIHLIRLSDGRLMREWRPDIPAINARSTFTSALTDLKRDRPTDHDLMMHPMLMADGGLVIHDSSPLARVDGCGRVEWVIDGIFHHSAERAADGSLYVVYRFPRSPMKDVSPVFNDEAIAHVSADGHLLKLTRIADVLDGNGLGALWRSHPYVDDPFHINEVRPVLDAGPYWQPGDLLLSLRNLSLVMLYRPSSGRVLWHQVGPWSMQHDVEIVDDHRISIFDNHWRFAAPDGKVDGANRVAVYDFATAQVSYPYAGALARYTIATHQQGRQHIMPNGDLVVEDSEGGRLLRFAPDGTLRWEYFNIDRQHRLVQLRWSRYLDPQTDGTAIQAAVNARCN